MYELLVSVTIVLGWFGFATPATDSRHRPDHGTDRPGGGRRPSPVLSSSPVPQVLWAGSSHPAVRPVRRCDQTFQAWQRAPAHGLLDGRHRSRAHARKQFPGQVRAVHAGRSCECRSQAQSVNAVPVACGSHLVLDFTGASREAKGDSSADMFPRSVVSTLSETIHSARVRNLLLGGSPGGRQHFSTGASLTNGASAA